MRILGALRLFCQVTEVSVLNKSFSSDSLAGGKNVYYLCYIYAVITRRNICYTHKR